jgi:NTE family protein
MRTVTRTADLVQDPSVVLVQPEMEGMAQWTMSDVPRLIAEGRRAALSALDGADRGGRRVAASDDGRPEAG